VEDPPAPRRGQRPARALRVARRQPTRFITTLLIGNNLVNIAATALVTQMSIQLSRQLGFSEAAAVAYATVVMTLLVLVFGEITPKSIAVHNPVAFSRVVIRPVYATVGGALPDRPRLRVVHLAPAAQPAPREQQAIRSSPRTSCG
jgi:Mg2+/Co2+ transporter CorB